MTEIESLTHEMRDLARRMSIVEDVLTNLVEEQETARLLKPSTQTPKAAPMTADEALAQVRAEAAHSREDAPIPRADVVREIPAWMPNTTDGRRSSASASANAATQERTAQIRRERVARAARLSSINWLGAISVLCFVLAGAFIVVMAVQSGWLTPARQIGLAAILGVSLIGAGLRMLRHDREYASLLPGAGIIVLYLTAVAACTYHHLINFEIGLAVVALISAVCIWLYTVVKHEVYPVTAALGAYVTPFLLGGSPQTEFILFYHVACSISFATISIWLNSRLLSMLAAYLAIGVSFFISSVNPFDPVYIWVLLAHFAIFAVAVVVHSVQRQVAMTEKDAWSYFPVLLIFYAGEYSLISKLNPVIAPYISLGFAAALVVLYFVGRAGLKKESLASANVVAAYASIVAFHSGYLEILPDSFKPWLLPIIVFAAACRPRGPLDLGKTQVVPMLVVGGIVIVEYFRIIFLLIDGNADPGFVAVSIAAPASLAFLFAQERKIRETSDLLPILFMAHALTILAFYNIAKPFGSLAVSGIWLAYAVVIMALGFSIRDKVVAKSALATLGIAAAKALLYDASMAPALVRIGCLLVTGVVLYGCGYLLKKIEAWS